MRNANAVAALSELRGGAVLLFLALAGIIIFPSVTGSAELQRFTVEMPASLPASATSGVLWFALMGAFCVVCLAITMRLMRQKQRIEEALNNMSQGLAMFDATGRVVLFNSRYLELYGLSATWLRPGRTLIDLLEERRKAGTSKAIRKNVWLSFLSRCEAVKRCAKSGMWAKDVFTALLIGRPRMEAGSRHTMISPISNVKKVSATAWLEKNNVASPWITPSVDFVRV